MNDDKFGEIRDALKYSKVDDRLSEIKNELEDSDKDKLTKVRDELLKQNIAGDKKMSLGKVIERVPCSKCGCLILRREGETSEEVLKWHRLNKYDTVVQMIVPGLSQSTRELNPCYDEGEK